MLSITIRDIRINKDINEAAPEPSDVNLFTRSGTDPELNVIDFRLKKVPPSVLKFAQFMSINVQNISVVMMNINYNPSWFLHATAGDLHLDGSTLHSAKTLIVAAALSDAHVSICIFAYHSMFCLFSRYFSHLFR